MSFLYLRLKKSLMGVVSSCCQPPVTFICSHHNTILTHNARNRTSLHTIKWVVFFLGTRKMLKKCISCA